MGYFIKGSRVLTEKEIELHEEASKLAFEEYSKKMRVEAEEKDIKSAASTLILTGEEFYLKFKGFDLWIDEVLDYSRGTFKASSFEEYAEGKPFFFKCDTSLQKWKTGESPTHWEFSVEGLTEITVRAKAKEVKKPCVILIKKGDRK